MAGIQKSDDAAQYFSGAIKPTNDTFIATISEISEDQKRISCEYGFFGINDDVGEMYSNRCLANFEIQFSPSLSYFADRRSANTYSFGHIGPTTAAFTLYGTGDFVLLRSDGIDSSYVSHGKCEKTN
jgi:hypothetical protein